MAALMQTAADKLATGGLFQQASSNQAGATTGTGTAEPLAQAGAGTGASSSPTGIAPASPSTAPEPNVSERVAQITSSGSPLMQLAATRAAQAGTSAIRSSSPTSAAWTSTPITSPARSISRSASAKP